MSVQQTVENVYIRQNAIQLTRRHFWRLLGMAALVYLITSGVDWLLSLLSDAVMAPEIDAYMAAVQNYSTAGRITSSDALADALANVLTSPKFLLCNLVDIVIYTLVSGGLTLGMTRQRIETGRGQTPRVLGVFSQMRYCLKDFGLTLWMGFKVTLWMLPGFGVLLTGAELSFYTDATLGNILSIIGFVLFLTLTVLAALRYSQARLLLADEPDRGIRDCVTFSKGLMQGRKRQYFKVGIPAMLKTAGIVFAASMAGSLVLYLCGLEGSYIASEILSVIASLTCVYFLLQLDMVYALYYLKLREPVPDKPVSYWLRDHVATDIKKAEESPSDDMAANDENDAKENDHEQPDC